MPATLYNEGRVVGYSAYEMYVKQALSIDSSSVPASEKEWLASSLGLGSSMLLRIGTDSISGLHYRDVQFPSDCRLCAANTILASLFLGEGYIGTSPASTDTAWATKVTDYGPLIQNNTDASPSGTVGPTGTIPPTDITDIVNETATECIRQYAKIADGIIIQPGTWTSNADTPPTKNFSPTMSSYPRLRIAFSDAVTSPFYVLLTGFTNRVVVNGTSGFGTSNSPDDGDFLGPWAFPWSAKVIFSVPPCFANAYMNTTYSRKLPSTSSSVTVSSDAIIDMTTDPSDYYDSQDSDAVIQADVTELSTARGSASVIATRILSSGTTFLPPSLYGAKIIGTGETDFCPFDTFAPGTVHMYHGDTDSIIANSPLRKMRTVEYNASGASAFVRSNSDYVIYGLDKDTGLKLPVANVFQTSLFGTLVTVEITKPIFYVEGTTPHSSVTFYSTVSTSAISETILYSTDDLPSSGQTDGDCYIVSDGYNQLWRYTPSTASEQAINGFLMIGHLAEPLDNLSEHPILLTGTYHNSITNPEIQEFWTVRVGDSTTDVSGTTVMADPLQYCSVSTLIHRRVSGKLSTKIRTECGYENVYDADGARTGVFASTGIWENATLSMWSSIPAADRINYWGLVIGKYTSGGLNNNIVWPIRKSDNMLDVTDRFQFRIYVNNNGTVDTWTIPSFQNIAQESLGDTFTHPSSQFLGSWWGATDTETYHNTYAYIHIADEVHPQVQDYKPSGSDGQIYLPTALLPQQDMYSLTMTEMFGDSLTNSGIHNDFKSLTVIEFLRKALYTNMSTGETLTPNNPNILQLKEICTSGDTESDIQPRFNLEVNNTSTNAGKAQLMYVPEYMEDETTTDPLGIVIQTGRKQRLVLSMSDENNIPYSLNGTSGSVTVADNANLTWYDMLTGLSQDKKINTLGQTLSGFRDAIVAAVSSTGSGTGTFNIQISDGEISLVAVE